jgi:signal peptidase I
MADAAVTENESRNGFWRVLIEWVVLIGIAFLIARLVTAFVVQPFQVPSGSMIPTIMPNDRLMVSKINYELGDPKRGDVAVFKNWKPTDPDLIKRVIALPGETIAMDEAGRFTIDGKPLDEPYLAVDARHTVAGERLPYTLGPTEYWMMGDNRNNSGDSRFNGPVQRDSFIGKALFVFWPLGQFRLM